jgi:hypothetical protein
MKSIEVDNCNLSPEELQIAGAHSDLPTSIEKVVIHAGLHKTATSTIQRGLNSVAQSLEAAGYLYVENFRAANAFTLFSLFYDPTNHYDYFVNNGFNRDSIKKFQIDSLRELITAIRRTQAHTWVVSEEHLCCLSLEGIHGLSEFLRKLLPTAEIEIVFSVRNPVSYLESEIAEWVVGQRMLLNSAFQLEFLEARPSLYQQRIQGWLTVFEEKRVSVFKFEDSVKHRNGPYGNFVANVLGVTSKELVDQPVDKINEGRSLQALSIISYVNEKIPFIKNNVLNPQRSLGDIAPLASISGDKFHFNCDQAERIFQKYGQDLEWLEGNFQISYLPNDQQRKKPHRSDPHVIWDEQTVKRTKVSPAPLAPVDAASDF